MNMLFKCRLCGCLADDGDLKEFVCLHCIDIGLFDEVKQMRLHTFNKKEMKEVKKQ